MATTSTFPNAVPADATVAASALVNEAIGAGFTGAQVAALGESGLQNAILTNLISQGVVEVYTVSFNPASVNAAITAEQAVTVTGVATTDYLLAVRPANGSSLTAGTFIAGARISAADTVQITFGNVTAGALDPSAAIDYVFIVLRP
jgi:hypothetical protein